MKKSLLNIIRTLFLIMIICFTTTYASNEIIYATVTYIAGQVEGNDGLGNDGLGGSIFYHVTASTGGLHNGYKYSMSISDLPVGASVTYASGSGTITNGNTLLVPKAPSTSCDFYVIITDDGSSDPGLYENLYISFDGPGSNDVPSETFTYVVDAPVPVELTTFSGTVNGNVVSLKWATATEVNNYGFEIERFSSLYGTSWEKIGFVNGNGNSNSPKEYRYTDKNLKSGSYSYRLKQIDNDGSYDYSNVVEIKIGVPTNLELKQNYPNPFNPSTTISFTIPNSGDVSLKIFNLLGEEVATLLDGYKEAGVYKVNFNAGNLPSGMYIYRMKTDQALLTKKMSLLK